MRKNALIVFMLMAMHAVGTTATAEDIDLFVGVPPSSTDIPNVLFMVDNTANWNTPFANEKTVMVNTFNNLPVNADGTAKFRVGVMLATETGNPNNNVAGGYVRAAIRPMTDANKTKYAAMFNTFDVGNDKGNGGKSGLQMAEAYRYFAGGAVYAGNSKVKADYTGNTGSTWKSNTYTAQELAAMQAIYALSGNALSSFTATTYNSPIPDGYCGKNYIIYISNGPNQESASDDTATNSMLSAAGGSTTTIPISPSGSQSNPSDEFARFMKSTLGVITYTVDVDKISTGQGPGWTALLKSMANVSGGKYFSVRSGNGGAEIAAALGQIFSEIQAHNSVFASVTLPVSVNTQGTYLNQVYVGMFRPDADAFPRWAGNLKQYKLGYVSGVLRLQDADSISAINNTTGFITECARSFWTPNTTDTYWSFKPQGGCLGGSPSITDAYKASNYPDGNVVEKGAQAYRLRSTTSRTVKTCSTTFSDCTDLDAPLPDFSSTYATQSILGAASTTERDALIRWAKGLDVDDENLNGICDGVASCTNTGAEMRSSAHGDVVHSRPVAINFGTTDASPSVVVFYGDNNGVLHAVNGNRSGNIGSVVPGAELWAFIPPEFFPHIKRMRDNSTQISYFGNPNTSLPKPYGFDGTIAAYKGLVSGNAKAFIYATMRRGGRALYAFDVTTPASPSLKWKVGCPNNFVTSVSPRTVSDTGCNPSTISGMGQSWSPVKVFKAGFNSGSVPLLIMGGGYDTCEDADPNNCASATSPKGNHIYVLNADTGALLQTFDTDRAVIGEVFIVPDSTGLLAKYAYAVDLGGNIYRISGASATAQIGTTAPSQTAGAGWTLTKIASLGCSTPGTCTGNRKFMFLPDVVEPTPGTYNILVGSGDREKPLAGYSGAYGVSNYFFMVKDQPATSTWLSDESGNCGGTSVICLASLLPITSDTPSAADLANKKGWYLGLSAHEQVVTSALTFFGNVTFSTHQPAVIDDEVCASNLGDTRVYNINFADASSTAYLNPDGARYQNVAGDGLPPSPVAGKVILDDGTSTEFVIGATPDSPLETLKPLSSGGGSQPKTRVYWYLQQ